MPFEFFSPKKTIRLNSQLAEKACHYLAINGMCVRSGDNYHFRCVRVDAAGQVHFNIKCEGCSYDKN